MIWYKIRTEVIVLQCKYLLSNCEAKPDIEMESSQIWLVQAKIWIAASKFDKFCQQKLNKHKILFCAVFEDLSAFINLQSWVGTIFVDLSMILEAWLLR